MSKPQHHPVYIFPHIPLHITKARDVGMMRRAISRRKTVDIYRLALGFIFFGCCCMKWSLAKQTERAFSYAALVEGLPLIDVLAVCSLCS